MQLMQREFALGGLRVSLLSIATGLLMLLVIWLLERLAMRALRERLLPRVGLNHGVSVAITTLLGYLILLVGVLVALPVMLPGFNLGMLSLALGAISFGVGFGLRNIADNFVSGIILLVERPIKVGDRIEVGGLEGQVVGIRVRSTTVLTNDNINIIVPNSEFASSRVTNLSHNDNRVRFKIPVGVHYRSDPAVVERALLEAAAACPDVLKSPQPVAFLMGFGDSSLNFELRIWSSTLYDRPSRLRSQVNFAIWHALKRHEIEIPYPQRDLYVKELPAPPTDTRAPSSSPAP